MNENHDLLPDLLHEEFEVQMRGYSRRQVDEFVARRTGEIRDLEQRLSRSLDENEHLRREVTVLRQQGLSGKPAHEEVSERIAQILKLADDEAHAQRDKANDDINKLRTDAATESDRVRTDAREQAERMLTAAQEQAERTIAAARAEADKTRTAARAEADRLTNDARKKSEVAVVNAKASAKKTLDEATARATAIHDGAERRLNMLSTRHSDVIRRLNDLLDGVSSIVAAENARPSLEDEVELVVAKTLSAQAAADARESDGLSDGKPARPPAASQQVGASQSGVAQTGSPQPIVSPVTPAGAGRTGSAPTAPVRPAPVASSPQSENTRREPRLTPLDTPPAEATVLDAPVANGDPRPVSTAAPAATSATGTPAPTPPARGGGRHATGSAPPPNPATRVASAGAPPTRGSGSIDPDEPAEGVRLMPS